MIPKDFAQGLYGAWLLARLNRNAINLFENSIESFWRSFNAAFLCVPIFIGLIIIRSVEINTGVGSIASAVIYSISYVISWIAFPYAMYHVTRLLGTEDKYFRYISAYNWATCLQLAALFIVSVIGNSGFLPQGLSVTITMAVVFSIFGYKGFLAHVGLGIRHGVALAIVLLDFILALIFESWTLRLLQAAPITSGG